MFQWLKNLFTKSKDVYKKVKAFINKWMWAYELVKDIVDVVESDVPENEKYIVAFNESMKALKENGIVPKDRIVNLLIEIAVLVLETYGKDD